MTMKARKVDIFVKQLTMADEINWEEGGKYFRRRIFLESIWWEYFLFVLWRNNLAENIGIWFFFLGTCGGGKNVYLKKENVFQ